MADLQNVTQDVTLFDNESSNYADITADHELKVYVGNQIALTDAWETYVKENNGYAVNYSATIAGKDLTAYVLIANPASSGKNIIIKQVGISMNAAATISTFYLYKNPTVTTAGGALTEVNLHTIATTGIGVATSAPTVSSFGSLLAAYTLGSSGFSVLNLDTQLGIYIDEGGYFLVAIDPETNNTTYNTTIWWAEAPAV
jgi:hypothetical protein